MAALHRTIISVVFISMSISIGFAELLIQTGFVFRRATAKRPKLTQLTNGFVEHRRDLRQVALAVVLDGIHFRSLPFPRLTTTFGAH